MASSIIDSMGITYEQFAFIGSSYYITYALMQPIVGLIVDKFGVRLFLTIASGLCAVGVIGFAFSDGFWGAFISRMIIGYGSSFAYVSLLMLALNWFPTKHFGFVCGLSQFLGAIGPLLAGAPVAYLLKSVDSWRSLFLWSGYIGIILTICIGIFIRNKPKKTNHNIFFLITPGPFFSRMRSLLSLGQIWWIMLYSSMMYVSLPLLGAYWGTTYMETRGFTRPTAALIISMIWVGLSIGCPLWGRISDLTRRRKPFLMLCGLIGAVSSFCIIFINISNLYLLLALFILVGIASAGQSLAFPTIAENVKQSLRATTIGLNNAGMMLAAAVFPPIITTIIQNSANKNSLLQAHFTKGFIFIPIVYAIGALIALFFIRGTFCREQNEIHRIVK